MRSLFVLAFLLVVPMAHAQFPPVGGGSIALTGLDAAVTSDGTQASKALDIAVTVDAGTCPLAGGSVVVHLTGTTEDNATVQVPAAVVVGSFGSSAGLQGTTLRTDAATLVVDAGIGTTNRTIVVDVAATGTIVCINADAVLSYDLEAVSDNQTFEFASLSGVFTTPPAEQPLPGFEAVLAVAALAAVGVLLRRKA